MEGIGSNFYVAWAALLRRYDNRRLKLPVQLNKLLSMPPASSKSVAELTHLIDVSDESRRALRLLDRPIDQWDDWFVHLIVYNLDANTRKDWEKCLEGSADFPTYNQLISFLEGRTQSLDTAHCNTSAPVRSKQKTNSFTKSNNTFAAHHSSESTTPKSSANQCVSCKAKHHLPYCQTYQKMAMEKKLKLVRDHRLCHNCLPSGHGTSSCPSSYRCRFCGKKHHSTLHSSGSSGSAAPTTPGYVAPATHNC